MGLLIGGKNYISIKKDSAPSPAIKSHSTTNWQIALWVALVLIFRTLQKIQLILHLGENINAFSFNFSFFLSLVITIYSHLFVRILSQTGCFPIQPSTHSSIPDMIFGENNLKFAHVQSGFELACTPIDAI